MRFILKLLLVPLPWTLRRRLLEWCFGYRIDPTARIGLAWVYPEMLTMGPRTTIDHLTVCKGLELVEMEESSFIGRGNWITGFPKGDTRYFAHQPERRPALVMKRHSAFTNRHIIDCTNTVTVGEYATVAGFATQILTHSIDVTLGRQSSEPVSIGAYTFVGTNCVLLGGSVLPDFCVLGAKSLLNKCMVDTHTLYGGVAARPLKTLPKDSAYFLRKEGWVY